VRGRGAALVGDPTVGVSAVNGGTYDATTHTVTGAAGATTITITLAT
jgi:hypothetical protein